MDYANATLAALADDLGVMDILTLDRRGFPPWHVRLAGEPGQPLSRSGSRAKNSAAR